MTDTATTTPAFAPIALIEVLDTHNRVHARHRLTTAGDSCSIGRSVTCDIVLDDPYAAAQHTSITLLPDGRVSVEDLGSRNGTRVGEQRVNAGAPITVADNDLIVGRTHVRIRTAHTKLPAERLFRRDLLQRHRTLLAVFGLVLSGAFAAFSQWIAAPESLGSRIFMAVIATFLALGIWVGLWGLITRVGHGAWTLRTHIAIAANTVALCAWSGWLLGVATFAFQSRWLEVLTPIIVAVAILGALFLHLRKATHLTIRATLVSVAIVPVVITAAALVFAQQNNASSVNRFALGIEVYPPKLRVATSTDLNDYLAQAGVLKREANRKRQVSLAERPLAD